MFQIDPLNCSRVQKLQYPEEKFRLQVIRKSISLFPKQPLQVKMSTIALLKDSLCLMKAPITVVKLKINTFINKECGGRKYFLC